MMKRIVTTTSEVKSSLETIFTQGFEHVQHYWDKKTSNVLEIGSSQSHWKEKF